MSPKVSHRIVRCEASCNDHDCMLTSCLYQRKSLSRLSLRPKRKTSRDSDTAGSRTHRDSATDEDAEVLTLQSSRSSISGRSSITSGKGNFYRLRPLDRAGSSTRTFYHFIGSQAEGLDVASSSAGHTPFLNGTPSRTPISTPKETPGVELEEMPWETKPVPPPRLAHPKAHRGILKQTRSRQDLSLTTAEADLELRHRPSFCENCKQGMGPALTPSTSQDPAMSELVARLHAAEVAAEVEALHPKTPSPAHSNASSDKSAAGVADHKTEPMTMQSKALAETPTTSLPFHQPTTKQSSRFHENIAGAARSTPTLTRTPRSASFHIDDTRTVSTSDLSMALEVEAQTHTEKQIHSYHERKHSTLWRPKVLRVWMARRKKPRLQ